MPAATASAAGAGQAALLEIPANDVIFKELAIKGFWGRVVSQEMAPAKRLELVHEIIAGVASGALSLPADGVYSFDAVAEAVAANGRIGRSGKVLLRP